MNTLSQISDRIIFPMHLASDFSFEFKNFVV